MKKRILIIDDDEQLNKINEKILLSSGVVSELHFAHNGKEALDYLRTRVEKGYLLPHIIITDLDMPVINGFQFIDAFHHLDFAGKRNIELVVFTASSSPKDRIKATAKGIRHYIEKPYLLRPLRDIIAHMRIEDTDLFDNRKMFGLERTIL